MYIYSKRSCFNCSVCLVVPSGVAFCASTPLFSMAATISRAFAIVSSGTVAINLQEHYPVCVLTNINCCKAPTR